MKKILLIIYVVIFTNKLISNQKIFFSSIPKCGTHLLSRCLSLLTNKGGMPCHEFVEGKILPAFDKDKQFIAWHVPYSIDAENILKSQNFKSLFIYRDPRDQIISYIFFAIRDAGQIPRHQKRKLFPLDFNDLLTMIIKNVNEFYRYYIPWIDNPFFCTVRFEDLIGEKGGGKLQEQINIIEKICKHIDIEPEKELIENCIKNMFGGTFTFREGKIGSWKKFFTEEHKKLFKEHAGQLLIDLKYEIDLNW